MPSSFIALHLALSLVFPPGSARADSRHEDRVPAVSILGGILAGLVGRKLFDAIWGRVDDLEPPHPEHREVSLGKLAVALVIEGAIFRLVKGLFDHAARRGFARWTGAWPGEERPEQP
jgi:Protein of unknown function (DUF4235)